MRLILRCLSFTFLVACLAPVREAAAQSDPQHLPCSTATTTADMSQCEQNRFSAADRNLQTIYKRLLDQSQPSVKLKLRAAETSWLIYRKAEADFQASAAEGGTLEPLLRVTTLADLTERRAADLQKSIHP